MAPLDITTVEVLPTLWGVVMSEPLAGAVSYRVRCTRSGGADVLGQVWDTHSSRVRVRVPVLLQGVAYVIQVEARVNDAWVIGAPITVMWRPRWVMWDELVRSAVADAIVWGDAAALVNLSTVNGGVAVPGAAGGLAAGHPLGVSVAGVGLDDFGVVSVMVPRDSMGRVVELRENVPLGRGQFYVEVGAGVLRNARFSGDSPLEDVEWEFPIGVAGVGNDANVMARALSRVAGRVRGLVNAVDCLGLGNVGVGPGCWRWVGRQGISEGRENWYGMELGLVVVGRVPAFSTGVWGDA